MMDHSIPSKPIPLIDMMLLTCVYTPSQLYNLNIRSMDLVLYERYRLLLLFVVIGLINEGKNGG